MLVQKLAWLVFPASVVTVFAAAHALLESGAPLPVASTTLLVGMLAFTLTLERIAPHRRAWNRAPEGADLALLVVNRAVDIGLIVGVVTVLGALERRGVSLAAARVWPTAWPLPVQAALGIVVAEAIRYAMHRLSHRDGVLWRWHRVHHEPSRMYTLNGPRLHPANQVWVAAAHVAPMLVMGAEVKAVVFAASVTAFFVLLQHANVALPLWGWNRVFATPDVHRLHHARDLLEPSVNYGIVLLVFDRLFGTYLPAEAMTVDEVGIESAAAIDGAAAVAVADGVGAPAIAAPGPSPQAR